MAGNTFPLNPTLGQMFVGYDREYFFNGSSWTVSWAKTIGSNRVISRPTAPAGYLDGTFWLNPINRQLSQLKAGSWTLIQDLDTGLEGDPVYVINSEVAINEASSVTVHVDTVYVPTGTQLSYEIVASAGSTFTSDDLSSPLTGTFTVTSGTGSFTITAAVDAEADNGETFDVIIKRDGTTVGTQTITLNEVISGNGYNGFIVEMRKVWNAGDAPYAHMIFHKTLDATTTSDEGTDNDTFFVDNLDASSTEVAAFGFHFSQDSDEMEPSTTELYELAKYVIDNVLLSVGASATVEQFRSAFYGSFSSMIAFMENYGWYENFELNNSANWSLNMVDTHPVFAANGISYFEVFCQSGHSGNGYANQINSHSITWATTPTQGAVIIIPGSAICANNNSNFPGLDGIHNIFITVDSVVEDEFNPGSFTITASVTASRVLSNIPSESIDDGGSDQYDTSFYLMTSNDTGGFIEYGYGYPVTGGDAEYWFGANSSYIIAAEGPIIGFYATGVNGIDIFGISSESNSGADGDGEYQEMKLVTDTGEQGIQLGEGGYPMDEFVVEVLVGPDSEGEAFISRLQPTQNETGTVYWGDGTWTDYSDSSVVYTPNHVYSAPGKYIIRMKNFQISSCPHYVTNILQFSNKPLIDCEDMFNVPTGEDVQSFSVTGTINTAGCTTMARMFKNMNAGKNSIAKLLTNSSGNIINDLDSGAVTTTHKMFYGCADWAPQWFNVTYLPNVTDLSYMFYGCESFNVDVWIDAGGVTDFSYMFAGCTSFDQGGQPYAFQNSWNPVGAVTMDYMFQNCTSLTTPGFGNQFQNGVNTAQPSMIGMFQNCSSLNQYMGGWNLNFTKPDLFDSGCAVWDEANKPVFAV